MSSLEQSCVERRLAEISTKLNHVIEDTKEIKQDVKELRKEDAAIKTELNAVKLEQAEAKGSRKTLVGLGALLGGGAGTGVTALLLKLFGGGGV